MRVGYGLLTALLLLVGGTPVQAQKSGAVEIGAFGRFTKFESKLNFDNRLGVGGRLGVFVLPNLALEEDDVHTDKEPGEPRTSSHTGSRTPHLQHSRG